MFRFPGGSSSDTFHFNAPPTYNGEGTAATMAEFIASVGGAGLVTLDYGTGSPQEAAAFLAYLDGAVGNTTAIGSGEEWNSSANTWVQVNWQTASYWVRPASTPLTQMTMGSISRASAAPPLSAFQYFEVGNEEYGSRETRRTRRRAVTSASRRTTRPCYLRHLRKRVCRLCSHDRPHNFHRREYRQRQ